jgi:predicted membrane protein
METKLNKIAFWDTEPRVSHMTDVSEAHTPSIIWAMGANSIHFQGE